MVTLWIDVEDLFGYARHNARPSGIQRVAFGIAAALHARHGGSGMVRFVRHDTANDGFRPVAWEAVTALFATLTETAVPRDPVPGGTTRRETRARRRVREAVHRLSPGLRHHLTETMQAQERAFHAWAGLLDALARGTVRLPRRLLPRATGNARRTDGGDSGDGFHPAPGDMMLALGAPWSHPNYPALIARHRARNGLRFALLVHDIIPIRRPEWFEPGLTRSFRACLDHLLPLCDGIVTLSRATAADVTAYAGSLGLALPSAVTPIPVGTRFRLPPPATPPRASRPPPTGRYGLFVSTIEVRKNHLLLFRVWRRLLEELPADQVPTLVFAGRTGWLVDDLLRQIANTNHLDGKLIVLGDATDMELVALYRGCMFTLFPSFHEGWGLPVTESLALGKPCLVANRTSLPEAAGGLARLFDPDNLHDAFTVIRDTILDPEGLARWEDRIRRTFQPVPWDEGAQGLLKALGLLKAWGLPAAMTDGR